jgi:hypothetical protein
MPVAIKGTGGGSVTLSAKAAATDTTLTLPNVTGTVLQSGTAVTVAQGGTGAATLTANAVLIGNGTSAVTAVAPSTAGNVLTSNGSAWTSTAPSGGVPTPSAIGQIPFSTDGSTYTATQKIVQGTAVASTSGTAIDFTSIPSWVKRVTVMFNGVSTSGTSALLCQIGTSGGIVSSGYSSGASNIAAVVVSTSYTAGFGLNSSSVAAELLSGVITIAYMGSNLWASSSTLGSTFPGTRPGGGSVTLSGTLDRVRITTVNGTDTFDAGSINILYE